MHWRDPFLVRSFRFQWPADLTTSWAFEMETIVLGWFILVESGSVMMLVVFGSLQYLGSLVSPMFGVVGDRLGYRRMLYLSRALYAALAATFMLLAWLQALTPVVVLVIAALAGLVRPSDMMMRNALIAQTLPPRHLLGALGISRLTADSARLAGAVAIDVAIDHGHGTFNADVAGRHHERPLEGAAAAGQDGLVFVIEKHIPLAALQKHI